MASEIAKLKVCACLASLLCAATTFRDSHSFVFPRPPPQDDKQKLEEQVKSLGKTPVTETAAAAGAPAPTA